MSFYRRDSGIVRFAFDRVFDCNSTQAQLYDCSTAHLITSVLGGINSCCFAYGATGMTPVLNFTLRGLVVDVCV